MSNMSEWISIFEKHGYAVDTNCFGNNDAIASNSKFCVPFTVSDITNEIAAVSFPESCNIDIRKKYKDSPCVGYAVFEDFMNNRGFEHSGYICNHDHNSSEIDWALSRM